MHLAVFLAVLSSSVFLVAFLVPVAAAQPPPPETAWIQLQMGEPDRVAVEPGWSTAPVGWTVWFMNAAVAEAALADGKATLTWSLDCGADDLRLGNATTPVPPQPGETAVSGVAVLGVQAAAGTRGMEALHCTLGVRFSDSAGKTTAEVRDALFERTVDFVDGLSVAEPQPRMAGPQKQIPFAIDLSNGGNSRTRVDFAMDQPGGMWNAILPETVVLEPGGAATAVFVVLTPFRDGYNSEGATFALRVLPAAEADPGVQGEPRTVEVQARTEGWYVPGPSPLLALAALAGAASVLRRRG
jgi:hypothetical protein